MGFQKDWLGNGSYRWVPDAPTRATVELKNGESAFVEVVSPSAIVQEEMLGVLGSAAAHLGLKRGVSIKWFYPAAECPASWRVVGGESFSDLTRLKGTVRCGAPEVIWLRRDLKGDHLLWVALHETEHAAQHVRGDCGKSRPADLERKADEFADAFVPEHRGGRRVA
jgi:hypothetical protein